MKTNISYEESLEILKEIEIPHKGEEKIFFGNSLGRVLSQDIIAQEDMPPYPTSAMDGYAFNAKDLETLKNEGLKIAGINKAGESIEFECGNGECIKTFTGSRMPKNCDMLVLIEHTQEEEGILKLSSNASMPQVNQWIRQKGENYIRGERLLTRGTQITPFEIGLLADLNCVFVSVFMRPKIAILSGGDEIIEVGETKRENTIRSVNNHLLKAIAQNWGAEVYLFPMLKDEKESIRSQVLEALKNCDILITAGGASRGDFDFVQEVLKEECQMQFKGVRMKPGKPVGFGIYQNRTYVFGLPGFPNSCAVTFMLFVRIVMQKLLARLPNPIQSLEARLLSDITRADQRAEFRICDMRITQGKYEVGFWSKKTLQSSVINNFCNSNNALMILEENGKNLKAGDKVEIILLERLLSL